MTKKILFMAFLSLSVIVITQPSISAQDNKAKNLERPAKCDVKEVDDFVSKSFDSYDESKKITEDINFIKVEGDGKATPLKITNGKGEILAKDAALVQFGELLIRAKKQSDNIKALEDMQKSATESIKKCPMAKKPKATKNLGKGGEALTEVAKQSKSQVELLGKQINDLKTIKDSK
jgi:hypothetical protein